MTCGIYKITNNVNGKIYIGQSVSIERRWAAHKSNSKNDNSNNKLYNSMNKYGIDNFSFEIINICPKEKLNERECFWINVYDSILAGLNSSTGGHNTSYSREIGDKLSLSKLNNKHFLGHKHSEETKKRMSKNHGCGKGKIIIVEGKVYNSVVEYGRQNNLLKNRAKRHLIKLGIL